MKNKINFTKIIFAVLIGFLIISCNTGSGDDGNSQKSIKSASFDSDSKALTVETDLPNGKSFTVAIDSYNLKSSSEDGKAVFDLSFYFTKDILGGTKFSVNIKAEDGKTLDKNFIYLPHVSIAFVNGSECNVFNSGAQSLQLPEIIINYRMEDCKVVWSFQSLINSPEGEILSNLNNFSEAKAFLSKPENEGNKIFANCEVIPNNKENLKRIKKQIWKCNKDKEVKNVTVEYDTELDRFVAKLWNDTSHTQEAGGAISYSWETSNDNSQWTPVDGQSSREYKYGEEILNRYLRAKIVQTLDGTEKTAVYGSYADKILGKIHSVDLSYEGVVLENNKADISKVLLNKVLAKFTSEPITDCSVSFIDSNTIIYKSMNLPVLVTKKGWLPALTEVFTLVKGVLQEYEKPVLLSDSSTLYVGYIQFSQINNNLEYRLEKDQNWTPVTKQPFKASTGDKIFIRKCSVGVENKNGYVMESDEYEITVTDQNIGKLVDTSGFNFNFKSNSATIKKTYDNSLGKWKFEVVYSEGLSNAIKNGDVTVKTSLSVDNPAPEEGSITYSTSGDIMYIDTKNWPKNETFSVFLLVTAKNKEESFSAREWVYSDQTSFNVTK